MKALLLSFTLLFFFSCSKLETALKLAPHFLTSKIDDAFDFKSAKVSAIRNQLGSDIEKNKKAVALGLIDHIDATLDLSKKDKITAAEVSLIVEALRKTQLNTVELFKPTFDVVLNDLRDEEIVYFKKHSDRKLKKDLKEAGDRKDFLKDRMKSILRTLGYFFENISDQQKKLVEKFVNTHYEYFVERIEIRKKFSDSFHLKLLAKEPTVIFVMNYFSGEAKDFSLGPVKAYLDDFSKFQAEFWNITSPVERNSFRQKLMEYRAQLKAISSK